MTQYIQRDLLDLPLKKCGSCVMRILYGLRSNG